MRQRDAKDIETLTWRTRIFTLVLLFLVSLLNYMDRFALGILLPAMKADLAMSDAELGFLAGGAISIFYVLAAIPVGRVADRYSKRLVIATSVATWSIMTSLCGLASSFAQLAVARIFVGIAQAGATAPSNALIADLLPKRHRATGLSIYALGLPAGVLVSFYAGGVISGGSGWRMSLILFGLPGLLLAVVVAAALPSPRPGAAGTSLIGNDPAGAASQSIRSVVNGLALKPSFVHVCLGSGAFTVIWVGLLSWLPSFFVRTYGLGVSEVGARLGLVLGCGQAVGILAGGLVGDRLGRRDLRWYLWICAASSLLVVPFVSVAILAADPGRALVALLPAFAFGLLQGAPAMTVVQSVAPAHARAVTTSTYLLVVNVVGGLGSQAIGVISDWISASGHARPLGTALMLVVVVCAAWSAVHFWIAARSFVRDADLSK